MADPILIHPYFLDYVLPFVLVFTLIFAILQKSKLLGDGQKQIDALVGLVVGLVLIAFPPAQAIVVLLMPFLAVGAVLLLVFMLLYGFIVGKTDGDVLSDNWKRALVGLVAVALVIFFLFITGYWDTLYYYLFGSDSSYILMNVILIVIIAGAIWAVVWGGKKED